MLNNKISKFLIAILLSTLFISTNSIKVLADCELSINKNEQMQFLEEKRKSQNITLKEKQKKSTVEGMLSSKDVENRQNDEIEKENKVKEEQTSKIDTFSQVVKSIKRLQSKKHTSSLKETSTTNKYYKNTNLPIIKQTTRKTKRLSLSEPVDSIIAKDKDKDKDKENTSSNSLLGQVESIKDLIDKPLPNSEPVDMVYSDIEMLERIVMAESGGEPYLGQIAVANVVLNRVKSNRYPSSLEGVIFQKSQFSPVKNNVIRGRTPNQSVKKAVSEALNGRMIVPEDTLYFVNPALASDQTIPRTKKVVKVIGSHTFYK